MKLFKTLHESHKQAEIIKRYEFTNDIDTFIITFTKEDESPTWYDVNTGEPIEDNTDPEIMYNVYVSRKDYGTIHFVAGAKEECTEGFIIDAIDFIKLLSKEIAEGTTDCQKGASQNDQAHNY